MKYSITRKTSKRLAGLPIDISSFSAAARLVNGCQQTCRVDDKVRRDDIEFILDSLLDAVRLSKQSLHAQHRSTARHLTIVSYFFSIRIKDMY